MQGDDIDANAGEARTDGFRAVDETVRTPEPVNPKPVAPHEVADKRFEVRLTASQLARWRTIAAGQGVALADMIRAAMAYAEASMPAGYVVQAHAREAEDRFARVDALLATAKGTDP